MGGYRFMKRKEWKVLSPLNTGETAGGRFEEKALVKEGWRERLQAGPGEAARQEVAVGASGPAPSRWTLRTIRASVDWLTEYTLSGSRGAYCRVWSGASQFGRPLVQPRPGLPPQGAAAAPLSARRRAAPGHGGRAVPGRVWLSALAGGRAEVGPGKGGGATRR